MYVEQNTMGRYPANTVAANIKDHYTVFAPLLKKSRCIWDITDNNYGKETWRRKAYENIEKKLRWKAGRGKANYKNVRTYVRKAWVKQTGGQSLDEFEQWYIRLFGFLLAAMDTDRVQPLKTLVLMYISEKARQKSSKLVSEVKATLNPPNKKTTQEPGPSAQSSSDPERTEINDSHDNNSRFAEYSEAEPNNEAEPGLEQPPVFSVDANLDGRKTENLSSIARELDCDEHVVVLKAHVTDSDTEATNYKAEPQLDQLHVPSVDPDDDTENSNRLGRDISCDVVGLIGTPNDRCGSKPFAYLVDAHSNDLATGVIESVLQSFADVKTVDVGGITPKTALCFGNEPVLAKQVSPSVQDSSNEVSFYETLHDLTSGVQYSVGSDGLVFGGPNILGVHLDGCKTNWKHVKVWKAEDTWSYVGCGSSEQEGDNTCLSDLPTHVVNKKRKHEGATCEERQKRGRFCPCMLQ